MSTSIVPPDFKSKAGIKVVMNRVQSKSEGAGHVYAIFIPDTRAAELDVFTAHRAVLLIEYAARIFSGEHELPDEVVEGFGKQCDDVAYEAEGLRQSLASSSPESSDSYFLGKRDGALECGLAVRGQPKDPK